MSVKKFVLVFVFFLSGCVSSVDISKNTESEQSTLSSKLESLNFQQALLDGRDFYYPPFGLKMTLPEKWSLELSDGSSIPVKLDGETTVVDSEAKGRKSIEILRLRGLKIGRLTNPYLSALLSDINKSLVLKQYTNKEIMTIFNLGLSIALKKEKKIQYSFNRNKYFKQLGDIEYSVFPTDINVSGISFFQDYYSVFINGKVLTFILTYDNSPSLDQLEAIIKNLAIELKN